MKILYEDNHILAVEKELNILSQEDVTGDPDMLTLLKADLKQRYQKPGNVYLGLVHRLDRPVGGAMVFAKTSKAASRLSESIRQGKFQKHYFAVVNGRPEKTSGHLEHYLLKDQQTNIVTVVEKESDGKLAKLDYEVLQTVGKYSCLKINLLTGRSHQIRVQFASIGHPLYGDFKYGRAKQQHEKQLALWSHTITVPHPTRDENIHIESHPPATNPWLEFDIK